MYSHSSLFLAKLKARDKGPRELMTVSSSFSSFPSTTAYVLRIKNGLKGTKSRDLERYGSSKRIQFRKAAFIVQIKAVSFYRFTKVTCFLCEWVGSIWTLWKKKQTSCDGKPDSLSTNYAERTWKCDVLERTTQLSVHDQHEAVVKMKYRKGFRSRYAKFVYQPCVSIGEVANCNFWNIHLPLGCLS